MPKRSHLVPKSIVDSRGRNTTVYVKDGSELNKRGSALTKAPSIAIESSGTVRLPGSGPRENWRLNDYIYEASRAQQELTPMRGRVNRNEAAPGEEKRAKELLDEMFAQSSAIRKLKGAGPLPTDDGGPIAVIDAVIDSRFVDGDVRVGFSNGLWNPEAQRDKLIEVSNEISRIWLGSCSSVEAAALSDYASSGSVKYAIAHASGELSEEWKHFEAAVERSPEIEPFVTYSGVNNHYVKDMLAQAETGEVEFTRVFSSSLNPGQVNGFANPYYRTPSGESIMVERLVLEVETTRAACMGVPGHTSEMEVLLPKGRYEVLEVLDNITYLWSEGGNGQTMDKTIRLRYIEE